MDWLTSDLYALCFLWLYDMTFCGNDLLQMPTWLVCINAVKVVQVSTFYVRL